MATGPFVGAVYHQDIMTSSEWLHRSMCPTSSALHDFVACSQIVCWCGHLARQKQRRTKQWHPNESKTLGQGFLCKDLQETLWRQPWTWWNSFLYVLMSWYEPSWHLQTSLLFLTISEFHPHLKKLHDASKILMGCRGLVFLTILPVMLYSWDALLLFVNKIPISSVSRPASSAKSGRSLVSFAADQSTAAWCWGAEAVWQMESMLLALSVTLRFSWAFLVSTCYELISAGLGHLQQLLRRERVTVADGQGPKALGQLSGHGRSCCSKGRGGGRSQAQDARRVAIWWGGWGWM